ncbi:MAG TPA: L-histidine N(alpha)-methyltransferase [Mycobacteriales bacterium]|nr:L-histidine N(alpha)-methyltransferase [Mycobacteriales bacterium]
MSVSIESHLAPSAYRDALRADVLQGLTAEPKSLPPKWFYDEYGSELFTRITRLPEYYPTRAERGLLRAHAGRIAEATRARTLVELGSGASEKTRLLLSALVQAGTLRQYVPFDVDPAILRAAGAAIAQDYPQVHVHGVVGDFERDLATLPTDGPRLIAFLGSTIGNFEPAARARFLAATRAVMAGGDTLLLGTDLVKDPARLVAAYDDAEGVTAEFNRNVLRVINRELKADFPVEEFSHVAVWNAEAEWIEMRLQAARELHVQIDGLDLQVDFTAGEQMRTEISSKFRPEGVRAELAAAGLEVVETWTDGDFGLTLAVPR